MSKQVNERVATVDFVATAVDLNATRVQEAFLRLFGRYARADDGRPLPDVGYALTLVSRAMRDLVHELQVASDAHEKELTDAAAPRRARDEAAAALTAEIVGIRAAVEHLYGEPGLRVLGLMGATPTEPKTIVANGRKLAAQLRDESLAWPAPLRRGVRVDPRVWLESLEPLVQALEVALHAVTIETREAQLTLDRKNKMMAACDELYTAGASMVAGMLRLVGDYDLARKVRPTPRHAGTSAAEEEPPPPVAAPAAEPTAPETKA